MPVSSCRMRLVCWPLPHRRLKHRNRLEEGRFRYWLTTAQAPKYRPRLIAPLERYSVAERIPLHRSLLVSSTHVKHVYSIAMWRTAAATWQAERGRAPGSAQWRCHRRQPLVCGVRLEAGQLPAHHYSILIVRAYKHTLEYPKT